MEEVNVDRKSFYEFLETLFNRIDSVNHVAFKIDNKKDYRKIDGDYYKCKIEEYSLVYPDGKKIMSHNLISSAIKRNGYAIIGREREFDTSIITLEEIRDVINANCENYPFLYRVPNIIQTINEDNNFNELGCIVISDKLKEVICENMIDYLEFEGEAFSNLQQNLLYELKENDVCLNDDSYKKNKVRQLKKTGLK